MPKTPGRPVKKRVSQSQKSGRTWRIKPGDIGLRYIRTPSSLRLFLTFAFVIIGGFILLALPVASRGEPTSLTDALFTSTSAVCVTGLSVVDTAQHWNFFGQLVILLLMQVGGFGFMTGATLLFLAFGRKFSLRERLIIGRSVGLTRIGGLVTLVKQMALFTISVEAVGTLFFYWRFYSHYSPLDALWRALFHSVSSFNNAGFGILGGFSMADYRSDAPTVLQT